MTTQPKSKTESTGNSPYIVDIVKLWGYPGTDSNYAYFIIDESSNECFVIDPAVHEPPIMKRWRELKSANSKLKLIGVLTTHKHFDHSKGNHAMRQSFPNIRIYGGKADNIHSYLKENAFTHELVEGNTIAFGKSLITILDVPCHTRGHILYFITADDGKSHPSVFTGDTLFIGGVGHFFEGTPEQMQENFEKMKAFPLETKVYCGHEYAQSNYEFCRMIEPKNEMLEEQYLWVKEKYLKSDGICVPSTIKNEMATNVFMRTDVQTVRDNLMRVWNEAKKSGLVQLPNGQKFDTNGDIMGALRLLKTSKYHKKIAKM